MTEREEFAAKLVAFDEAMEAAFGSRFGHDVLCSFCRVSLQDARSDGVADHFVMDYDGSLDYIELAHTECVEAEGNPSGWEYDS